MTRRRWIVVWVAMMAALGWASTTDEKDTGSAKLVVLEPCALVLTTHGQQCR